MRRFRILLSRRLVALGTVLLFSMNLVAQNTMGYKLGFENEPSYLIKMTGQGDYRMYEFCEDGVCEFMGSVPNFLFASEKIVKSMPDPSMATSITGGFLGAAGFFATVGAFVFLGIKLHKIEGAGSQASPNTGVFGALVSLFGTFVVAPLVFDGLYESYVDWVEQKELSVYEGEVISRTLVKFDEMALT
ncbi:MAG: hypothetical protein VX583_14590, partial [Bdellovibrionota bacterium]